MLWIVNNFLKENTKLATKILFHLFSFLIIADVIWFFLFKSIYSSDSNEKSNYLNNIGFAKFISVLCLLFELIIKSIAVIITFTKYKTDYTLEDAFIIDYLFDLDGEKKKGNLINEKITTNEI